MQELIFEQVEIVSGGTDVAYGFVGATTGGSVTGSLSAGAAFMAGANAARIGAIGGFAGAAIGAVIGVGYYYYKHR